MIKLNKTIIFKNSCEIYSLSFIHTMTLALLHVPVTNQGIGPASNRTVTHPTDKAIVIT